ncbi:hypothetical protein ACW2QC_01085 [Virgibacillus sp. FSP13]
MTEIDRKHSFGILRLEDGFRATAISEGFWGWSVTDDVFISTKSVEEPFITKRETIQYKDNKKLDVILITVNDKEIADIDAYDKNMEKIHFGKIPYNDTYLYYAYSEKRFSNNITIKAYSVDKTLLYNWK